MEPRLPSPLEWRILNLLWKLGVPATVQELCEAWLPPEDRPGYTTVLKKLQVMEDKGLVTHHKAGKAHRFVPVPDRSALEEEKFKELATQVYDGNRLSLVLGFMKHTKVSAGELAAARALLDQLDGGEQ